MLLKRIVLPIVLLFCSFHLSAQEAPNMELKIETGLLMTSENSEKLGLFLRLAPKLKLSKKIVIGMRIGASINEQELEIYDPLPFSFYRNVNNSPIQFITPENGLLSIVPTVDYRFMENKFRPYLGVGVGYYFMENYTKVSRRDRTNPVEALLKLSVQNQVGFLLRGGLNFGKLIVGLEFNLIPKAEMKLPDGQKIGAVDNTYIGLSFGYAIGIGKSLR